MNSKGKNILILGIETKTKESLPVLLERGFSLQIFHPYLDAKEKEAVENQFPKLLGRVYSCPTIPEDLGNVKGVLLFGARDTYQSVIAHFEAKGIPVLTPLDFVLKSMKCPLIGVTGTNGKSSVAKLLEVMLAQANQKIFLGGSEFTPFLKLVGAKERYDAAIFELSSSVLAGVKAIKPKVAIMTNLVPAHKERHSSRQEYFESKAKIFQSQDPEDVFIFDAENQFIETMVKSARSTLFPVYLKPTPSESPHCAYYEKDYFHLRIGGGDWEDYPVTEMKVKGAHHRANALFALAAARWMGASPQNCRTALNTFEGLPHRLQKCLERSGLTFYDDSYSSNAASTAWALASLKKPVILISGGFDWGDNYEKLSHYVKDKAKLVLLFGKAGEKMVSTLKEVAPAQLVTNLEEAVHVAISKAEKGDTILFSPAAQTDPLHADSKGGAGKSFLEIVKSEFALSLELKRRQDAMVSGQFKI